MLIKMEKTAKIIKSENGKRSAIDTNGCLTMSSFIWFIISPSLIYNMQFSYLMLYIAILAN